MLALVGALALLGCPDDEDSTLIIGTQALALNPANAETLGNQTFIFRDGVPAFGTNGRTTAAFNAEDDDSRAGSEAEITGGGSRASANVTYASCTFRVVESTFPPGSPLDDEADPVTIDLCNLIINGGEFSVGGSSGACTIRLEFGTALSVPVDATCSVDADGNIVVNGTTTTGSVGVGG
jgi:hypothetical protein